MLNILRPVKTGTNFFDQLRRSFQHRESRQGPKRSETVHCTPFLKNKTGQTLNLSLR